MGWNGTNLKTSWLRSRSYGVRNSRPHWQVPFFCDGCRKNHGPNITRNETLDGRLLCDRQFNKYLDSERKRL